MAQLKQCDRCKKNVDQENEIGIVVGLSNFRVDRGYIRPSKRLLDIAKESNPEIEYFPIEFKKIPKGEIDLCRDCFDEFMKLAPQ